MGKKMIVGAKSDKETKLNYNLQPFSINLFDAISSVQLLSNDSHVSSLKTFIKI
jgi:hypothetical protein